MPAKKGNATAQRPGTDEFSDKGLRVRLTPKEHEMWSELAHALKVGLSAMVRDAVREKRERMIAAGFRLKPLKR